MAAPSYTEDLTDIDLAEPASTGWTAFNISGGGGGTPAFGADLGMQGTGCWDKAASNAERGLAVNKTPGAGTVAAGVHIYVWGFNATPGITDTLQNRGAYVIIGDSTSNFMQFHVEGSDTYGAAGRVAKCYPVDFVTTSNTGSIPYRTVNGTPAATPTYFGFGIKTLATAKGSNIGCDAIRYGTGAFLTAGELISAGDASDNPCTFDGFNVQNDNINNRWGIFTKVGTSFELQGKFAIGQNNAGTATLARFKDSDKSIIIPDTVHSSPDFSQIIIDHASTRVEWTNINIEALGTNNKGLINVINASSTVIVQGGTYTGIGTTVLRAGCDFTGTTWRGADLVTLNGATITDCTFEDSTSSSSVVATTLADITGCNFISDGSNHAVELTSIGGGSMNWDNQLTGYVVGSAGSPITPTSTGNEAIYVNVATSSDLTINVAAGASIPSIRVGASFTGNVNIIAGAVTLLVTVQDTAGTKIQNARVLVEADTGGPYPSGASVSITSSGTTASVAHTAHGMVNGDLVVIRGATPNEYNGIQTISNVTTNAYDYTFAGTGGTPASGSPNATTALISGLTDVDGKISDLRTYPSNQPLKGKVRKSTSAPYYKTGPIVGTVDTSTGASLTITMLSDE